MAPPTALLAVSDDRRQRFNRLFDQYYGPVLAYARRRASPETAGEVAADTFVVLWEHLDQPPAEPLPWLYAVARRLLGNQQRGERRRDALADRLAGQPTGLPNGDPADAALAGRAAREALDRLRPDDRELLMLIGWDGLDIAGAATVLGLTPAAAAVRLHRARRRLESTLADLTAKD